MSLDGAALLSFCPSRPSLFGTRRLADPARLGGLDPAFFHNVLPQVPRVEPRLHRGEWLLVHWYAHSDGEAVRAISRVETDGDRLTAISPHPEQLPIFFAKSVQRMREFKGWTPAQIQTIRAPTLLIVGDRDIVRVEHAVQMQHLISDARLAVFPATDHLAMTDRAAYVASMLDEFL